MPGTVRRRIAALVGLGLSGLLAACSNNNPGYLARFNAPIDIVKFTGITKKNPTALHDYFAVASARTGELALIDAYDNRPVPSPGAVYSLVVTTDQRPVRLAAAPLSGGSDLLVVVSSGSLDLQVIDTWTTSNRVDPSASVALDALVGEGEILSVAAFKAEPAGSTTPRARLLVALTGGRLVVVDFTRDATTGGVVPGTPVLKSIGVDALAMAIDSTTNRVYVATTDPLPTSGGTATYGVAWFDAGQDPAQPWPVGAIDARAPTNALAVGRVSERLSTRNDPNAANTFSTTPAFRIYAILDPSGCGPNHAINCGLAMLDENGLLPDPSGEDAYRAPLPIPGVGMGVAIMYPPASGTTRLAGDSWNPSLPLTLIQPGNRNTTAAAAVTSSNGLVWLYDLGRYSPASYGSAFTTGIPLQSAISWQPTTSSDPASPDYGKPMFLGMWSDFPVPAASPSVVIDPSSIKYLLQVTPGYTPSDVFFLAWQGELPGLLLRRGVIGRTAAGDTYAAVQSNVGTASQPSWVGTIDLSDPGLGVHGGDIVVPIPDDATLCSTGNVYHPFAESTVASDTPFLPADGARYPAGALKLAGGSCYERALAPGQTVTATLTVRTSGLVLSSAQLGYLGRPVFDQVFRLEHQNESTLTGEALAIARKVRRSYYPMEPACGDPTSDSDAGCYARANLPYVFDPIAPGPVMAFRAGLARVDRPGEVQDPNDPAVLALLPRGSRIIAQTLTGPAPGSFRPLAQGYLPTAILSYDPTAIPIPGHENDGVHFYTAYRDDQVLDITPSISGGNLRTIR